VARVEIRQLEELKVFNALRLSVEVLAEVLAAEVLAAEVLAEVLAEILAEILAELAAEIAVEIAGGTELEVLFVAVHYWDSLESYTSFSA
jgi:hypothetical protein